VERPARAKPANYPEPPQSAQPMLSLVSVAHPKGRAGVAAAGLHEYEADGPVLGVTLLRCVGWLSRDDLASRAGDAGPMLPTPEAQCQGPLTAHYAFVWAGAGEPEGTFERRCAEATVPARAFALHAWSGFSREPRLELDHPAWLMDSLRATRD